LQFLGRNKTAIVRHGKCPSHKNKLEKLADIVTAQPKLDSMLSGVDKSRQNFEIKIALWLAENNLPLSLSDFLLATLRECNPSLGKTKCTNIVRQVLGFEFIHDTVAYLREHKFSIISDETTDITVKAQCAVIAIRFDVDNSVLHVVFIDIVELSDGTANTIDNTIIDALEDRKIQNNFIGYIAPTLQMLISANTIPCQLY